MASNQNITGVNVTGNLIANNINVVIANQPLDPLPKNIRFKVEKPIQTFTGREAFLKDLHRVVKEGQVTVLTQAPFSVVAATGGIGKTETVRMYIQLHAHEYDHVIWIEAEDTSSARTQFTQLAIKLNICTEFEGKPKEFELMREQIFEKLLHDAHVVLLVLDNAEAFEDDEELKLHGIRCLLPKSLSPFFVEPTVIVTSRNQNWNLQKVIQLDLWTEAEVMVFVIHRLGIEKTQENQKLAEQLGNLFGRLPIALQAAVAVILQQQKRRNKTYGIQTLIDDYESGGRKVLVQKPLDGNMRPTQTSITMLVLWNISFKKIVNFPDGELAIQILCFMAYLSPTRIPQDFLFVLFQEDFSDDSFENALEILEDHCLIATFGSGDSESRNLTIHRMIQDATIENLKFNETQKPCVIFNNNTFLNETEVLLKLSVESLNYIETFDTRGLLRGDEIVENLVQITEHVSKNLDVVEFRDLTTKVAGVLRKTNDFAKCIKLYENVLKATPALGDVKTTFFDIVKLKTLKKTLAMTYSEGGFDQKSIQLLTEILEDQTSALGPHHTQTLGTKCNIATVLPNMGRFDEAGAKLSEALHDFQNNQDNQSEAFLTTKNNYTLLLDTQGKTEQALKLLTEVLEEEEKNPDLNSERIMSTKGNIATVLIEQGKFEEAAAMMLQTLSDATRVFGPFHLDTFTFKRYYASLIHAQGKHEEAAQLFLELLEIQETQLGSEHPDTLYTKHDLAISYLGTKEFDKALSLLDVAVFEKVFGPKHPQTMTTTSNVAIVMLNQGKFQQALSLHNKVLNIRNQVLGPNHPQTLSTMYFVGASHYEMKEFDKATEVFQDVLPRQVEILGEKHPETMETLNLVTKCKSILDERNDSIVKFMMMVSVDAELGRSLLEASNWNTKAALEKFFNSKSTKDNAGSEEPGDEDFIASSTTTDFQNKSLDVISANATKGRQIQDV